MTVPRGSLSERRTHYYCIRNYPGGREALAEACRPLLEHGRGPQANDPLTSSRADDKCVLGKEAVTRLTGPVSDRSCAPGVRGTEPLAR
jgi:hypothetical protein